MQWSTYSLDLNPIENLWLLLKEAIFKKHPKLLTMQGEAVLEQLIQAAQEAWNEIEDHILKQLSNIMVHYFKIII